MIIEAPRSLRMRQVFTGLTTEVEPAASPLESGSAKVAQRCSAASCGYAYGLVVGCPRQTAENAIPRDGTPVAAGIVLATGTAIAG